MESQVVTLTVPADYSLPHWYRTASAKDVASALDIACRIPSLVEHESERLSLRDSVMSAFAEARSGECESAVARAEDRLREAESELRKVKDDAASSLAHERHLKAMCEQEKSSLEKLFEERVESARRQEALLARETMQASVDKVRKEADAAHEARLQAEQKLCDALREQCTSMESHSKATLELQSRIHELETPLGRGSTGEVDVAQCLRDMGYVVEDTSSTGDPKNAGYLDLLAYPESSSEGEGRGGGMMRIALEVKNRKEIKRENIVAFQEHVRNGISKGLFDSAIFVSIRAHVKRDLPVALDMYEDASQHPLVPVSWVGPERAKNCTPLTQDQLEAHMFMHAAILSHSQSMRTAIAQRSLSATDDDVHRLQQYADWVVDALNDTFAELGKQHQLLEDMKANLTRVRIQCLQMFRALCSVNRDVSWLRRPFSAPWMATFENALRKAGTHTDTQIWNDCTKAKSIVEKSIGKDAMLKSLRMDSPLPKRARSE